MKQFFQYNWWKYLAVILIPILLWTGIFDSLKKPTPQQRVSILCIGSGFDTATMEQQLSAALPSLTNQPLKAITVSAEQPDKASLGALLTARVFQYDIVIIQQDYLFENIGQHYFSQLTPDFTAQFPGIPLYRDSEQNAYALQIGSHSRFSGYYTGSQDCYLFVSPESVNFDRLNGNGQAGNNAALKAVFYLLETPL